MKINEKEFKNADNLLNLKKIPSKEIKLTTLEDFWDGPLSGLCVWEGNEYYYHCFDQVDETNDTDLWPRKYLLIKLTKEQAERQKKEYELFENSNNDSSLKQEYLELMKQAPIEKIATEQIVGWFDSDGLKHD